MRSLPVVNVGLSNISFSFANSIRFGDKSVEWMLQCPGIVVDRRENLEFVNSCFRPAEYLGLLLFREVLFRSSQVNPSYLIVPEILNIGFEV